jgi:hypothetical protein
MGDTFRRIDLGGDVGTHNMIGTGIAREGDSTVYRIRINPTIEDINIHGVDDLDISLCLK